MWGLRKKRNTKLLVFHLYAKFFSNRNLKIERHDNVCDYLNKFILHRNVILVPVIEHMFWEKCQFECWR